MNKSTKWIILGLIVAFVGLVTATQLLNRSNYPYNTADIIPADEASGNLPETVSGNTDAPAKLVVYSDYQCNNCADLMPDLNDLIEEYDGKLAIVNRIMVMSYHQNGHAAAAAALAAANQGYWSEFKELLYTDQNSWAGLDSAAAEKKFEEYFKKASNNKGDLEKFREDKKSEAVEKKIEFDDKVADHDGVQWTPYIMFDGELISQQDVKTRAELLEKIREKIDAKLEKSEGGN